jgi:hypothetical protein
MYSARRALPAILVAIFLGILPACESAPGPRQALEVDVAHYIARVKQWAAIERDVSAAVADIFRSQFLDAEKITSITERMLPGIETHMNAIAAYQPKTAEVGQIHNRYARAWRRLREGFHLIDQGMRADDAPRLAQGRRRLEVWQEQMLNVAATLRDLAEEVGLSPTESAGLRPAPEPCGLVGRASGPARRVHST